MRFYERNKQRENCLRERRSIISILLDVHIVDICLSFNARKFFFFFLNCTEKVFIGEYNERGICTTKAYGFPCYSVHLASRRTARL